MKGNRVPIPAGEGRVFVTRHLAALALDRHPDLIRRHGVPVACRIDTRAVLYDVDDLEALFRDTPKRRSLTRMIA